MQGTSQFVDEEWPAGNQRLGKRHEDDSSKWVRAVDYNRGPNQPVLYKDGLEPSDISQGASGTCFLLAALAAIAHNSPELIKKMFLKHDVEKGIYMIKFYGMSYKGEKDCVVLLDDFLSLGTWGGGDAADFLSFNRPDGYKPNQKRQKKDLELWATLIEAAYCKINTEDVTRCGTYEDNYGGFSDRAIHQLTGMSGGALRKNTKPESWNPDQIWEIVKNIKSGDICCAGTQSAASGHHGLTKFGLSPGHAYAVISSVEIDGVQLIKMMNPWGKKRGEWTGDWSDDSPLWTKRMKAKANFTPGDDGKKDLKSQYIRPYWKTCVDHW